MTGYKGLSLSDNPFVSFVRCLANEIAHISIHHPFAKEELLDIISKGKILICDELETSLHESLLYTLLKTFLSLEGKEQPQIIFTAHDTSLLSLDLFRRDQIWFTELNSLNRSTELYSLAEIKSVRKDENYGKGYISGRYGAIPMLNENLAELLKNI